MSYGWWFLVILVTSLATFWVANLVMRPKRVSLERLADPAPLPYELPIAGRLEYDRAAKDEVAWEEDAMYQTFRQPSGPYGPWPVDTGPLLHLSEKTAANIALQREVEAMCVEAEAKIPPRWRS